MKTFTKISLLAVFLFSLLLYNDTSSAVYYDAETNSYVYETPEDTDTTTGAVADTWTNVSTDTGTWSELTTETWTGEQKAITASISTPVIDFSWPLEYLHTELVNHQETILKSLQNKYHKLRTDLDALTGGVARLETLQCLWLIDNQENLSESLKDAYEKLSKNIKATSADLHNNIDALESKMNQNLLEGLSETLEIAALQNKVDAYLSEYTNMVNMFAELIEKKITDADTLLKNASERGKETLERYDTRVKLYKELQKKYNEFIKKSSFAGALVGPNLLDVTTLVDNLKTYYTSIFAQKRFDSITVYLPRYGKWRQLAEDEYQFALNAFEHKLDKQIDALIGDLYPVQDLQLINKSMLTLSSAYVDKNWVYNCIAFSENGTIDIAAPSLETQMEKLLSKLSIAAKQVAVDGKLPRNMGELKKGLLDGLGWTMEDIVKDIVNKYKESLGKKLQEESITMLSHSFLSESDKREQTVRKFLQAKYYEWLHGEKLDIFVTKLKKAHEKLRKLLPKAKGKTKKMLEVIGKVIEEFL